MGIWRTCVNGFLFAKPRQASGVASNLMSREMGRRCGDPDHSHGKVKGSLRQGKIPPNRCSAFDTSLPLTDNDLMKLLWICMAVAVFACGCAGHRGRSHVDLYDGVKIDELTHNKVSRGILDRRTIWLNARREIHRDQSRDHFLVVEFTPSPDFTLQSVGESLVLLIDGVRHGFTSTNSQHVVTSRPGVVAALYPVAPELLVQIANAQDLRMRLKGTTSVVDESVPAVVQSTLRDWMLRTFTTPAKAVDAASSSSSALTAPPTTKTP